MLSPIAAIIKEALLEQDAATYNGNAGDLDALARKTAQVVREEFMKDHVVVYRPCVRCNEQIYDDRTLAQYAMGKLQIDRNPTHACPGVQAPIERSKANAND